MLIRLFQQTTMGPTAHSGLTPRYGAELKQPDKQEASSLSLRRYQPADQNEVWALPLCANVGETPA